MSPLANQPPDLAAIVQRAGIVEPQDVAHMLDEQKREAAKQQAEENARRIADRDQLEAEHLLVAEQHPDLRCANAVVDAMGGTRAAVEAARTDLGLVFTKTVSAHCDP